MRRCPMQQGLFSLVTRSRKKRELTCECGSATDIRMGVASNGLGTAARSLSSVTLECRRAYSATRLAPPEPPTM